MSEGPNMTPAQRAALARPYRRAATVRVTLTSTRNGLLIEGESSYTDSAGRREAGRKIQDAYRVPTVMSTVELLAVLAWWSSARVDMLPEAPRIEVGLPIPLADIAPEVPGSLPGEGKGRGVSKPTKV